MRTLSSFELAEVQGGNAANWVIGGLLGLNLLLTFGTMGKVNEMEDTLNAVTTLTIYQEAQLYMLPHYQQVAEMSFEEIFQMLGW